MFLTAQNGMDRHQYLTCNIYRGQAPQIGKSVNKLSSAFLFIKSEVLVIRRLNCRVFKWGLRNSTRLYR